MADAGVADAGAADAGAWDPTPVPLPGDTAACPPGFQSSLGAGQHSGFAAGGQTRSFYLALPAASFVGPRPLVWAFHGTGLSGAQVFSGYGLQAWVDVGAIVVAPDSNGNGSLWPVWDSFVFPGAPPAANADLTLFDDLLSCVAGHHAVDAKRLYVLGHSAGGAMTHFVLGHRSSLLAGGIAASGGFDLTQPVPATSPAPVTVIVAWGGANDCYSGSAGGTSVTNSCFSEQSALGSRFWEAQPGSHQIACRGADVGHVWLGTIERWMRDVLLAHPKGAARRADWSLPPMPSGARAVCGEAEATYTPLVTVDCPSSSAAGCREYCQAIGDCIVENGTLGPESAAQLEALGFANATNVCSGCVSQCEADGRSSAADATVLACLAASAPATVCGPGMAGAGVFTAVQQCCATPGSALCARFCGTFRQNPAFDSMVSWCP